MKKPIIILVVLVLLFIGLFVYATRPVEVPSVATNTATSVASTTSTSTSTTDAQVYHISSSDSNVEFSVGETLHGSRFIAIGKTSALAGDVFLTAGATASGDTTSLAFGKITVDARMFKTDSKYRDGAIARYILKSENPENEFIVFVPKKVTGAAVKAGGVFTVTGDLTIAGVTKPGVFAVTLTSVDSASGVISGTVTTEVKRSDFGLTIPSVSFVASVDDVVKVSVNVVAKRGM